MNDAQKLFLGALLAGGSLLTGSTALIATAGGIGVNWSSEALAGLLGSRTPAVAPGGPLANAYARAIRRAVDELRGAYPHSGEACTLLPAFDLVAACAGSISEAQFPPTLETTAVQTTLESSLERLLYGHDEREIAFLRRNLLPAVARALRGELVADDEAWRQYHGRLIEQLAAAAANSETAPAPVDLAPVLAALADVAATQAVLAGGAARLEELIRQWQSAAAAGGGSTFTFTNSGVQAGVLVQGEKVYYQSPHAESGSATVYNISGAVLPPDLLAALLSPKPSPAGPPPAAASAAAPGEPLLPSAGWPTSLSGAQAGALQQALLDAFTPESLRRMVTVELGATLEHVAGGSNFSAVVFDLISWAQRTGRLPDLLQGAQAAVPGNPQLAACLRTLGR